MASHTPYWITGRKQLEALDSPVRQEIVDALQALGPGTVAEIAVELNRAPDSLYYHLRVLGRVGLVREAGVRTDGARPEIVYDLPGRPMKMKYAPAAGVRRAIGRTVSGVLRLTDRDFQAALDRESFHGGEPATPLTGGRLKAWLDEVQTVRLQELLQEIDDLMNGAEKAPGTRLFALTRVLVPLDPNRRVRSDGSRQQDRKDA